MILLAETEKLTPWENRTFVHKLLFEWVEAWWALINLGSKKWQKQFIRYKGFQFEYYLSTMTAGICTSCTGLFPSFKACVKFKICPLITDICFSNNPRSKPLSCRNNSKRSLHKSSTKFKSESNGKTKSLISWLKGIFACGSQAQWKGSMI